MVLTEEYDGNGDEDHEYMVVTKKWHQSYEDVSNCMWYKERNNRRTSESDGEL